jgi:glycosyltransferase involved in cell wall biosynthesis
VITVLTATLGRRPAMLAEAIASVAAQTFTDWEHIVVDDGSFSVPDIDGVRVLHVGQCGLGPARNVGVDVAEGDAIALLDDDDLWLPEHLETVWSVMQRTDADVVYADCIEEGRRDGYHLDVGPFDPERLAVQNFICVPATLVRTDSLRAVGGFPSGALEDWGLWLRMHAAGMHFEFVPRKTVRYRFHVDNLTYGGVDPAKTAEIKRLEDEALAGRIDWDEFEARRAEVWG